MFHPNTSRSMFQILYFKADLLLQKAPLPGMEICIFTLLELQSDILNTDMIQLEYTRLLP